jgi:cation transport ATPase
MLRKIIPFTGALLILFGCISCQRSQDVVSQHWFQKRKHRPGFYLNIAQLQRSTSNTNTSVQVRLDNISQLPSRAAKLPIKSTSRVDGIPETSIIAEHGENAPLHLEHHRKHLEKNEAPSLQATAVERTEELEVLAQHQEVNKKKLLRSSGTLGLGVLALLTSSFLSVLPLTLTLLLSALGINITLVSLALICIHLIERRRLKQGAIFYTEQRIKDWTNFTILMQKTQLVGTILSAILGVVSIALTLSPALFIYGAMVAFIGFLSGLGTTVATLIGTSVGSSISPYSFEAKRALRLLILLPLISTAISLGFLYLLPTLIH